MYEESCKTCSHFRQHYILTDGRIMRVFCGHCTFSKPKNKSPFAKACAHYTYAPSAEESFVTKKYLTKEMIRYLFEMECLPSIDNVFNDQ